MTKILHVYSDGGARGNPGPAAIGVLVCDAKDEELRDFQETIGDATNNVAEYRGVIKGLELAAALGGQEIRYFLDSQLVACQLSGDYKVKTDHIRELFLQVKEKEKHFRKVTYKHLPREHEKIRHVDKLVNRALNLAGF
ncbi:MAG: ribonuclease HI family protein [Candidatus Omnitrophota bacterium]